MHLGLHTGPAREPAAEPAAPRLPKMSADDAAKADRGAVIRIPISARHCHGARPRHCGAAGSEGQLQNLPGTIEVDILPLAEGCHAVPFELVDERRDRLRADPVAGKTCRNLE
jgi:hypothetical protein